MTRTRVVDARREDDHWRITTEGPAGTESHNAWVLVNAAGPWVAEVLQDVAHLPARERIRLVRGSHIVTRRLFEHDRCYFLQGPDGRIVFVIPYEQDYTLIGTTDCDHHGKPGEAVCTDDETRYLCDFVSRYLARPVTADDVVWRYSGVRPLFDDGASSASATTRDYVLSLDEDGPPLLSVFGGKITTYRRLAEHALNKLSRHMPGAGPPWTAGAPLPGGDFPVDGAAALTAQLGAAHPALGQRDAERLVRAYGTDAQRMLAEGPGRDFGAGLTEAELRWMMTHEYAMTAEDALWRRSKLGLRLDAAQVAATKIAWILDTVEGARQAARAGHLAFGTVDSFLIWKLTGGAAHVTDATNAARTMLYDIHAGRWDPELCALLDIPPAMLPQVLDSAAPFGTTRPDLFGRPVPILGVAGDQQAAMVGQACFRPGMIKATYGTGCFALMNTGGTPVVSRHRMLTTIAYQLDGRPTYALEGSIFVAGAVVQWLRDALGLIRAAPDSGPMAATADAGQELIVVPAFTGLGAPYWEPRARGAVFGLTRNSGPNELARAALESVGFQTHDLWAAMRADFPGAAEAVLRVDGGMSASDWAMQFLADILGAPVDRPTEAEATARGAAWLAGMQAGVYPGMDDFAAGWALDRRFHPVMDQPTRSRRLAAWGRAVQAVIAAS